MPEATGAIFAVSTNAIPVEVLKSLSSEHYREVLLLQRTLTLVDARNLSDERYCSSYVLVFLPSIWWVTDRVIEPRLTPLSAEDTQNEAAAALVEEGGAITPDALRGLRRAGLACVVVVVLAWVFLTIGPGTPLFDEAAAPEALLLGSGILMTVLWVVLGLPLGPGASVSY